jgi:riboflavin synthase
MFTGLIEKAGRLASLTTTDGGSVLHIGHEPWDTPLEKGESIAVQGVCLTVTACDRPGEFTCDVLDESVQRSNLGRKNPGARLNLERALRAGDRLGGHIVSGHVDGTGAVASVKPAGRDHVIRIECGTDLLEGIVKKGSVACDGISLTVSALGSSWFEVNIIPATWQTTSLNELRSGDIVNIETDMIGKFVRRYLQASQSPDTPSNLTMEHLERAGFV